MTRLASARERRNRRWPASTPAARKTMKVPVIFHQRIAGGIIGSLSAAINGASIARGTSYLKEKMGEQLFTQNINIIDDPLRVRGARSRAFDGEGQRGARRALIENGVLTSWIMDSRSARQLGLASTGHASRGTSGPPGPSASNLYLEAGTLTRRSDGGHRRGRADHRNDGRRRQRHHR